MPRGSCRYQKRKRPGSHRAFAIYQLVMTEP